MSRKSFNMWGKITQLFNKSDIVNKYNVKLSKEKIKEGKKLTKQVNKIQKKQFKKMKKLQKISPTKFGQTKQVKYKPISFNNKIDKFKSMQEFNRYLQGKMLQSSKSYSDEKNIIYKNNYLTSLVTEFGENDKRVNKLREQLSSVEPNKFYEIYVQYYFAEYLSIDFVYDESQKEDRLNALIDAWDFVLEDEL